jgi:osmotically inducible protein OsmC
MPARSASADWDGSLTDGNGVMALGSRSYEGPYTYKSRFQEGQGTNPEELIGAAHAGCFSMALSGVLSGQGHAPEHIHTDARVHLISHEEGFKISLVELITRARVPGLAVGELLAAAETAKRTCPVSRALAAVEITIDASLEAAPASTG